MAAWKWGAVAIGFGILLAPGCGSNPEPSSPANSTSGSSPGSTPNPASSPASNPATNGSAALSPPTPEPVNLVYELDPAKHSIPVAKVAGMAAGARFSPLVVVEDDSLVFRTLKPETSTVERQVRIKLGPAADSKTFDGRKAVISQDLRPGPDVPEVYLDSPAAGLHLYPNGYALTLELGHRQNGMIPGRIYLGLPDTEKTMLAGTFEAAYPRQPGEPPGPEDRPLIAGGVKVIGAPVKTVLRVGYFADEQPGVFHLASADLPLGDPTSAVGSVRVDWDKPRVTTVLAGDGKTVAAKYEHSKLTTGRYLVYAVLEPAGPVAWTWVTVLPGETHTADLTIDATRTGGVEITAPLEAVKDVKLSPADKPGFHAMEPDLLIACAQQFGLEQAIVTRKALFKNLTPGRYWVRVSSGQLRDIEIVAGKIVELDFDKPQPVVPKVEPEKKDEPKKM